MGRKLMSPFGLGGHKLLYICTVILAAGVILYLSQVGFRIKDFVSQEFGTLLPDAEHNDAYVTSFSEGGLPKIILYWTSFFGEDDYDVGFGKTPFKACPVSNCVTTNNRSLLNLSDALIFHPRDTSLNDLPSFRSPNQRWILFNHEPPMPRFTPRLTYHANLYNWTMTYRFDSDMYHPYFVTVPFKPRKPFDPNSQNMTPIWTSSLDQFRHMKTSEDYATADVRFDYDSFVRSKTKSVAWVVSNCYTNSKREVYVRELAKYIDVDIYGKCGHLVCERGEASCLKTIGKDYKFYLSFENSICTDYVTEKLFNALSQGVVPVVFGIDAHKRIAPPHSFIDARKFKSPQALAEFLHTLIKNEELYKQYLLWNNDFRPDASMKGWCDLCKALHDPHLANKKTLYANIHDWWFNKDLCFVPRVRLENGQSIIRINT